jgi:transposase-like protein
MAVSFKGAHCPQDIILMGVRWYLAYPLSTRPVEERMLERGVHVEHSTVVFQIATLVLPPFMTWSV